MIYVSLFSLAAVSALKNSKESHVFILNKYYLSQGNITNTSWYFTIVVIFFLKQQIDFASLETV